MQSKHLPTYSIALNINYCRLHFEILPAISYKTIAPYNVNVMWMAYNISRSWSILFRSCFAKYLLNFSYFLYLFRLRVLLFAIRQIRDHFLYPRTCIIKQQTNIINISAKVRSFMFHMRHLQQHCSLL